MSEPMSIAEAAPILRAADPEVVDAADCISCPDMPANECPESKRPCGHHCNCSWIHDHCHWCGVEFGETGTES